MTAAVTLPAGARLLHLPAEFPLRHGGCLRGAVLAYELQGPPGAPVVVVQGGISAHRHLSAHRAAPGPGWWEGLVGDGLPLDTAAFRVLAFDWLGGAHGSTAPAAGEDFPLLDAADQAAALACLLDELGIQALHAFVGCSYGGMVGLQFAARWPQRVRHLLAIVAAHRSHPQASGFRAVQRRLVELGLRLGDGRAALQLARELALLTYRSPRELQDRCGGPLQVDGGAVRAPIEAWLTARGAAFAAEWLPEQFLALCRSIDVHCVDPRQVAAATTLVSVDSDQLVPAQDVRELAAALPRLVRHRELRSRYGHDAFLKELRLLAPVLQEVLQ